MLPSNGKQQGKEGPSSAGGAGKEEIKRSILDAAYLFKCKVVRVKSVIFRVKSVIYSKKTQYP